MEYLSVKDISEKWGYTERQVTRLCRDGRIGGVLKNSNEWLIPSDALKPIDKRTKGYDNNIVTFDNISGRDKVISAFINIYNKEPMYTAFTPYRVCPLGAHVDHNLGKITGFAIDKGIHIAYSIKQNGVVELESLQFPKRAQWHVLETPSEKQNDWADHLRGATIALSKRYPLRYGISAVIGGELPIGGLSSSAAVIITFINALAFLNNIKLNESEMIDLSKEAENKYVGVSCGRLDQSCEVYSRKNKLLYMDMLDNSYKLIDTPKNMKPYLIGIFFSGLERSLSSSKYNMRTDELRSAAYELKALSNMEYGKFNETNLRDVPYEVFLKYKDKLPTNFMKRAQHFYEENERVSKGIKAYEKGDIVGFGKLVTESGYSSIHLWETGSSELIKLYEILKSCKGVYGTRFSGAGFKGCCMSIIDPKYANEIEEKVKYEYLNAFPNLEGKYSSHICHTADGVKL